METTDPAKAAENLLNQIGTSGPESTSGEIKKPDIEIIDPDPEHFTLAGRKYEIRPLPIKKLKLINKFEKLNLEAVNDEALDSLIEIIGKILDEKDLDFLSDYINMENMAELFIKITNVNLMAFEKKTKAIRGI